MFARLKTELSRFCHWLWLFAGTRNSIVACQLSSHQNIVVRSSFVLLLDFQMAASKLREASDLIFMKIAYESTKQRLLSSSTAVAVVWVWHLNRTVPVSGPVPRHIKHHLICADEALPKISEGKHGKRHAKKKKTITTIFCWAQFQYQTASTCDGCRTMSPMFWHHHRHHCQAFGFWTD